MKVVTAQQMQDIDRQTIEKFSIPGCELMERAGLSVASKIQELFPRKKVIVFAGGGNNGGDGIVAAMELFSSGWDVRILLFADKARLSPDSRFYFEAAVRIGLPVEFVKTTVPMDYKDAVIVDALFGTGLDRNIKGHLAEAIERLNHSSASVVSVDIPSGISADTGEIMGAAVKADCTVTFGLPKRGHFLYPGAEYTGRPFIENIGFPEELLVSDKLKVELLGKDNMAALIQRRPRCSHKGDYGHVLIVAGSKGRTGAALMAAKACMRAGSGLVTIGVPASLADIFQARATEEMILPLPDRSDGTLSAKAAKMILGFLSEKADVLCIGPGIGVSDDTQRLMEELIISSDMPMLIDADGINSISQAGGRRQGAKDLLKKAKAPIILTPHAGEMSRLLQSSSSKGQGTRGKALNTPDPDLMTEIEQDRIETGLSFSRDAGVYLVLKGVPTVIAGADGSAFINSTGNPGMATAGTGDVLSGIISSFAGQGLAPIDAAALGVYMHGLAGDIAADEKGEHSLIASDLIEAMPGAFRKLTP